MTKSLWRLNKSKNTVPGDLLTMFPQFITAQIQIISPNNTISAYIYLLTVPGAWMLTFWGRYIIFESLVLFFIDCVFSQPLVPHFYDYDDTVSDSEENVSMPSRASTSFLLKTLQFFVQWYQIVSMPSRASTSFLQYPFKNLGFMRFLEPVFAGICQNILTMADFYACS